MLKKILTAPVRFIDSLAERIITIMAALAAAQFPAFIVQYQQRLGGHVEELSLLIAGYRKSAQANGKTLEEFISVHLKSSVPDFSSTGKLMSENLDRFNELSLSLSQITEAHGFFKFTAFIENADIRIFRETTASFVPGLSFSPETLYYGLGGIIFVMIFYFLLKKSLQIFFIKALGKGKRTSASVS